MKEFNIKLTTLKNKRINIRVNLVNAFDAMGYRMYIDYAFEHFYKGGRYDINNSAHYLVLKSPKILQDQKVKELLVEHLI